MECERDTLRQESPEMEFEPIVHQFHSSLRMLGKAIEMCPEPLWLVATGLSPNRYWHIAYHALFYTHFYLAPSEKDFEPWQHFRPDYNYLGEIPSKPGFTTQIDVPYTRNELIEYLDFCHAEVDKQIPKVDFDAPSGFYWLPFNKLELQFYNMRHLAHHTGQLSTRLRSQTGFGL